MFAANNYLTSVYLKKINALSENNTCWCIINDILKEQSNIQIEVQYMERHSKNSYYTSLYIYT